MLIGILYLVGAGFAFGLGRYLHREILKKRAWPTVQGKLLERGVGEPLGASMGPGVVMPRVKYSYRVGGSDYVGDQCYLIRRTGALDHQVLKVVNALPEVLPVHYDPADPKQTYLISNSMAVYWILIGFSILAALIGVTQLIPR